MTDKEERVEKANKLLHTIGSHGRRFFYRQGVTSCFGLDAQNHVTYTDKYSGRTVRMTRNTIHHQDHVNEGGTLTTLVMRLREYILTGKQLTHELGPWPEWQCNGDLWDYGDDMTKIRQVARELGILPDETITRTRVISNQTETT